MTASVQPTKPPPITLAPNFQPGKAMSAARRGGLVWSPPKARPQPSGAAGHRGVIANGPLKTWTAGIKASLAERHNRRRVENRRRKENGYRLGIDY